MVHVLPEQPRRDVGGRGHPLRLGVLGEALEVALVRLLGARREPLLERDEVREPREKEGARPPIGVAHRSARAWRWCRNQSSPPASARTDAATVITRPERAMSARTLSQSEPAFQAR